MPTLSIQALDYRFFKELAWEPTVIKWTLWLYIYSFNVHLTVLKIRKSTHKFIDSLTIYSIFLLRQVQHS
jgi:hypothetical protein